MKLTVFLEHRFWQTPDGAVWTQAANAYNFWTHYLRIFQDVEVVARVLIVDKAEANWLRADGEGVSFVGLPCYVGPIAYLKSRAALTKITSSAMNTAEAVIFRVPSQIAWTVHAQLKKQKRPYAVEVVGDPWDVFAPGAIQHPLRPFFRRIFHYRLKEQCLNASAVSYVTKDALQRRYPHGKDSVATSYSDVDLPISAFVETPKAFAPDSVWQLAFVGSLAQMYKAPDVLIAAMKLLVDGGVKIHLRIIGDGAYKDALQHQVFAQQMESHIVFVGQIPGGEAVRHELDRADLFVLPSRTEGLPRAMIEAMARGLPCIGSTAGGIPELLPAEDLVPPGNAEALVQKIQEVLSNPQRMSEMSARNLQRAQDYRSDILERRRYDFYAHLRSITEAWLNTTGRDQ